MTWKILAQFFQHPNFWINNSKFVFQIFLKFSLSSSLSPKSFWIFTFSTTRLLKFKSGCFGKCDFLERNFFSAYLVGSWLKTIHFSAVWRIFLSHRSVHLQSLKDHRSLKIKSFHQQIVLTLLVRSLTYAMLCAIWFHLCNLKTVKNIQSSMGVFMFFKLHQIPQRITYIRKNNGPKIKPCGTTAWIISQSDVWP